MHRQNLFVDCELCQLYLSGRCMGCVIKSEQFNCFELKKKPVECPFNEQQSILSDGEEIP